MEDLQAARQETETAQNVLPEGSASVDGSKKRKRDEIRVEGKGEREAGENEGGGTTGKGEEEDQGEGDCPEGAAKKRKATGGLASTRGDGAPPLPKSERTLLLQSRREAGEVVKAERLERAEAFRRDREEDPTQLVLLTVHTDYETPISYHIPLSAIDDDHAEMLYQADERHSDGFPDDNRLQRLLGETLDCGEGWDDNKPAEEEGVEPLTARDISERGRWAGFRAKTGRHEDPKRVRYSYVYTNVV
jgi:hypothetical protein